MYLQKEALGDLKNDVMNNFPESNATFENFNDKTEGKIIADAMNKNIELRNAYVFPFQRLGHVNIFKRDYLYKR